MFIVQRKDDVGIYAQIVDHKTKKIGRFQVHSTKEPYDGNEYMSLKQAEIKQGQMIGVQSSKPIEQKTPHPSKRNNNENGRWG